MKNTGGSALLADGRVLRTMGGWVSGREVSRQVVIVCGVNALDGKKGGEAAKSGSKIEEGLRASALRDFALSGARRNMSSGGNSLAISCQRDGELEESSTALNLR